MNDNYLKIVKKLQGNFITGKEIKFLFCDIQTKYIKNIYNYKDVVSTAEDIAEASKILGLTQIVTLQEKEEVFGITVPEIIKHFYEKTIVYNKTKFAMIDENKLIKDKDKEDESVYVLMGIEAHICVTQTAIKILSTANSNLIVLSDGVSSVHKGDRNLALRNLEKMGAYVTIFQSLLFLLLQDSSHPLFKSLLHIFKRQFKKENKLLDEAKF